MNDTVIGYRFDVSCPVDGGLLAHTANGRSDGRSAAVVARCDSCRREWLIRAMIAPVRDDADWRDDGMPTVRPDRCEPVGVLHPVIGMIMAAEDEARTRA